MKRSKLSFILISLNFLLTYLNAQKCCRPGQQIVEKNSRFTCENLVNIRLQENFEDKDFFAKNATGTCLEIVSSKNVVKFKRDESEGNIVRLEDYGELYFPKCCPVGFCYNTTTHGCKEEARNDISILKPNSFIRVGLFQCRMISDIILDSVKEVKMEEKNLILLKERRILMEDFCVDSTSDGRLAVRKCEEDIQICSRIMCIHKCCPDGQSFINGSKCRDTFVHGVDLHFTEKIRASKAPFVLIHGFRPQLHPLHSYSVDRFGTFVTYNGKTNNSKYAEACEDVYCMEHVLKNKKNHSVVTMDGFYMYGQKVEPEIELKILVTRWVKIISCIFLILTILVYLLLPRMMNLFGKILLSYCVSTFTFFFVLVISQFYSHNFGDGVCKFVGFLSILASIWSFTWLHIMCIHIWFTFGTPRTSMPCQKNRWKRLLKYSLYGFGFPIMWVLMIAVFSATTIMPEAMHPVIGKRKCYLENSDSRPGNYSYLLYVIFPLLVQQIINITLFIKTILYCLKIKAEIERMNDSEKRSALNASKERLGLIMKLAVIMGVFFLFETVSSIHNFGGNPVTKYMEVVWDSMNCLQGLYIFIIFICKKKVFDSIREKILMLRPRSTSVSSVATTRVSMHNVSEFQKERRHPKKEID